MAVGPGEAGLTRQHGACGEFGLEVSPANERGAEQLELGSRQLAHDPLTRDLLPQRLGGAVPHHQVAFAKETGDTEAESLAVHDRIEDDRCVAQRAIGDDNRPTGEVVVDHLVECQDSEGVEAGISVQRE